MKRIAETTTLNNGVKMPWLGLGVNEASVGGEVERAIVTALDHGYRSIDTASIYQNEEGVGQGMKESTVHREDIFVTTKVWNDHHGYDSTLKAFDESRHKLGVDYVDLYLIHWPVPGLYKETWRALEKLYRDGMVRAIGVSNFMIHHIEDLIAHCKVKPAVNQVEYNPMLTQKELHSFCQKQNIQLEAWSPLVRGNILSNTTIVSLAEKYKKTAAQIILRWNLQNKVVTIPKSVTPSRIKENAQIFDFELTQDDIETIDSLNQNKRIGQHPDQI